MFISPSRARKQKRIKFVKNFLKISSILLGLVVVAYLFLSGFNGLEKLLGWKTNIISGFITGFMATWVLLNVIIRYFHKRNHKKLYDKLSWILYSFLLICLLLAYFLNFGFGVGMVFLFCAITEGCFAYYHHLSANQKKTLRRKLPWLFYR